MHTCCTRRCLICGKVKDLTCNAIDTSVAWLCDDCRNTLLEMMSEYNYSH